MVLRCGSFANTWFNHGSSMWFVLIIILDFCVTFFCMFFCVFVLCLVYNMLPVLLDCPFLIAHSFESKLKTKLFIHLLIFPFLITNSKDSFSLNVHVYDNLVECGHVAMRRYCLRI